MIFSQYKETCEVLVDYPNIVGYDIKYYAKKSIRNILHKNIDVHSRRLIAEFPVYGVKCIYNLQYHFANMNFTEKVDTIGFFNRSHVKESNQQQIISIYSKMHRLYQFKWETVLLRIS